MTSFSLGRQVIGSSLLLGLLAVAGCSSSKGRGETAAGGDGGEQSLPIGGSGGSAGGGADTARGGTSDGAERCGNGTLDSTEVCDDGNETDGDGCAEDCRSIETNYVCPEPGEDCVRVQVCGDKKITGTENCDDGNHVSSDGCSSKCRIEAGYTCSFLGAKCQATACGDGLVAGQEGCDDGQTTPLDGDGCSAACQLESPTAFERDGWVCPTPGAACVRTTCGNALLEGSEQCDDGDNDTGDGCSPFCRKEPSCPDGGGACSTACGDGLLLPIDKTNGQECDDGNTLDNDGCSADCKAENGFDCADAVVAPDSLTLPIVLRDFKGTAGSNVAANTAAHEHPDFEQYNAGFERDIVQPWLDADGKPQHVTANRKNTENAYANNTLTSSVDYFSKWYRDDPDFNITVLQTLTFAKLATGEFRYANASFFQLNDLGFGNYKTTGKNFHFTSEVRYWFEYHGGETLQFKGDDDVWVFVNQQLAVDLGGVHGVIDGSVVLNSADGTGSVCENIALGGCTSPRTVNLGLLLGNVYEIVVFQAERHTSASNYTLTLGNFDTTRSVCTSQCGDGVVTPDEACDLGAAKNTGEYGTCTADCKLPAYCGDGKLDEPEEACDDGLNLSAYGYNGKRACSPQCQWTPFCGDKQLNSLFGEQCDDGNAVAGDGCEANCTHRTGCGNGERESNEQCDDGNTHSGDGCSEFCTTEAILW